MKSNFIYQLKTRLGYRESMVITRDEFNELAENESLIDELEELHDEALKKETAEAETQGFDVCKDEELKPLLDNIVEFLACYDAADRFKESKLLEDKKLAAELPEAIEDIRNMVAGIEKRLKL